MDSTAPKVSVGLPVFNGERFLESALDGLAGQTYGNLEIIISDNASTDRTEAICRAYAARHPFIRYSRNAENIGGFRNNNRVIDLAIGKYFLLTGHDDLRDPTQIERCVEVLERDEDCVLCYTATVYIDVGGRPLDETEGVLSVESASPTARFREVLRQRHRVETVYGVVRRSALGRIRFRQFADSDRVWVAELALRGKFRRIPDPLFFRRQHAQKSTILYPTRYARAEWFNPGRRNAWRFPHVQQGAAYFAAITAGPIPWTTKLACYWELVKWLRWNVRWMLGDLRLCMQRLAGPWLQGARSQTDQ
jgi:glycosyltransferase involved in cell wall biosynthesis